MTTPVPDALPPAGALRHGIAPPQRIDLGHFVIRRWHPDDIVARFAALTASYRELHQWMAWAAHPITWEQQRAYTQHTAASWPDPHGACAFGIFDPGGAVLGSISLEDRIDAHALEIGYWCHSQYNGRGIITRAARALTDIALALPGIERTEIHCDTANVRSAAIPRRLGYRLERIEPRPIHAPAETGHGMVWATTRPAAARTPPGADTTAALPPSGGRP